MAPSLLLSAPPVARPVLGMLARLSPVLRGISALFPRRPLARPAGLPVASLGLATLARWPSLRGRLSTLRGVSTLRGLAALGRLLPPAARVVRGLALGVLAGGLSATGGRRPLLALWRSLLWASLGALLLASLVWLGLAGVAPTGLAALGLLWSAAVM